MLTSSLVLAWLWPSHPRSHRGCKEGNVFVRSVCVADSASRIRRFDRIAVSRDSSRSDAMPFAAVSARDGLASAGPRRASHTPTRASSTQNSTSEVVRGRSEEHTSELQSRENLVCRLLLEK